jgi:hypothetical protein
VIRLGTALNALGLSAGVVSAVCLFYGSRELPREIESWTQETPAELRFFRRRKRASLVGFGLLALGFALQLIAVLVPN